MFAFVQKDKSLSQAKSSGASPNEQQLKKLMNFMINDPFFQDQMIDDFLSKPENSWMNNVSKNAQVRFLKIITSVPLSKISDAKTMAGIVKRLLSDKEIGPALKKQYGNNITADLIASSQGSLQSSMSSAQHKLSKYWFLFVIIWLINIGIS